MAAIMLPEVRSYLDEVRLHLRLDPTTEEQIMRELCTYFQEGMAELHEDGLSESDAAKITIGLFGRARVVARRMYEAHSKGSWFDAVIAASPHLIIALLFAFHLWHHPLLMPLAIISIVGVTLYGWWHGKPSWLYPWIGYSLLPLLVVGYISAPPLRQATSFLLSGEGSFPSGWALLLILALSLLSISIIVSTTIRVARRDWILASLMLVPLPVVGGWLVSLERSGGLFQGSWAALHYLDSYMTLALLALAVTSAAFVRLRQRVFKIGAIFAVSAIAFAMIGHNVWGPRGFFGLLTTTLLLLAFLLLPLLLETKMGHGEERSEAWWGSVWP